MDRVKHYHYKVSGSKKPSSFIVGISVTSIISLILLNKEVILCTIQNLLK